jgi:Tfp pilus assembly protein PilE
MITLTTTIVLALSLIVWLSLRVKAAKQNQAKVRALLERLQVAAEKVVVQKNYQQEQIDFILKHAPSTRS